MDCPYAVTIKRGLDLTNRRPIASASSSHNSYAPAAKRAFLVAHSRQSAITRKVAIFKFDGRTKGGKRQYRQKRSPLYVKISEKDLTVTGLTRAADRHGKQLGFKNI